MPVHSKTQPAPRLLHYLLTLFFSLLLLASCGPSYEVLDESRQATGVKVGEVTESFGHRGDAPHRAGRAPP